MNICKNDIRIQKVMEIEQELTRHPENKVYIWGTAKTAGMITDFLHAHSKMSVEGYIVDDAYYRDTEFLGTPVYKASTWMEKAKSGDYVIMGFTDQDRAKKVIDNLPVGVTGIYFYFPYSANETGSYLTYEDYTANQDRFIQVYEKLADELSKETMEAFINACITGEVDALEKLRIGGQYFNDLTKDCKAESFIDCGAYVGDTIEEAVGFYGDRLKKIVAFEPDERNVNLLRNKMQGMNISEDRVELVIKGTWSKEDTLHFSSSDSSSSISADGDIEIHVDSLDHVLEQASYSVDFVKMDVEGSEKESLLGSKNTIQKNHPLLAVCTYHKPEDLYVLPELIEELAGKDVYRYYFRYHGPDLRELVFYALPIE